MLGISPDILMLHVDASGPGGGGDPPIVGGLSMSLIRTAPGMFDPINGGTTVQYELDIANVTAFDVENSNFSFVLGTATGTPTWDAGMQPGPITLLSGAGAGSWFLSYVVQAGDSSPVTFDVVAEGNVVGSSQLVNGTAAFSFNIGGGGIP